jgi:hypothetical protein
MNHKLLIIDELGFVPLSKTSAKLLLELISQRYERGATIITLNLPFDAWTATFRETPNRQAPRSSDAPRPHPGNKRQVLPPGLSGFTPISWPALPPILTQVTTPVFGISSPFSMFLRVIWLNYQIN